MTRTGKPSLPRTLRAQPPPRRLASVAARRKRMRGSRAPGKPKRARDASASVCRSHAGTEPKRGMSLPASKPRRALVS